MTLLACRDCAAIQSLPPLTRGRLECHRCGRPLEQKSGRSIDAALACAVAVLLLLFPANFMALMTVHVGPVVRSSKLPSGLAVAWDQGWPLVSIVLALEAIILPFTRFGLVTVTLAAIRLGRRDRWLGAAFRWSEMLDQWAMSDVLLIGAGIGYGRIASQVPVAIDPGGWCFVVAALLTMLTRATLERREVWRRLSTHTPYDGPDAVGCTGCDLLLPPDAIGHRCPRCGARVHRRRPHAISRTVALLLATAILTPVAYGLPMSAFWKFGKVSAHTIINGIELLFQSGFWYFGIMIFLVSLVFPLTKLLSLAWFLTSIHRHSTRHLRRKTRLYRFIDEIGRWSTLDPFTVLVFAPMIQLGQIAHFDFMGGCAAFLDTVVLSMLATRTFDPRLMGDAAAAARTVEARALPAAAATA